jgi:isopenicillin N synthase-like dioxygenase
MNIMTKIKSIDLPTINLSSKHMKDPTLRKQETKKLIDSFSDVGFCLITGIEGYNMQELLKWTKWYVSIASDTFDH